MKKLNMVSFKKGLGTIEDLLNKHTIVNHGHFIDCFELVCDHSSNFRVQPEPRFN